MTDTLFQDNSIEQIEALMALITIPCLKQKVSTYE
jgi:hypothetical protein